MERKERRSKKTRRVNTERRRFNLDYDDSERRIATNRRSGKDRRVLA